MIVTDNNIVQDLIEQGEIVQEGHSSKDEHVVFKDPLINHEK